MVDIVINSVSESYIQIEASDSILQELSDIFTFDVPNARFSPSYKKKHWDGKIRLLNLRNRTILSGLIHKILEYAKEGNYEVEDNTELSSTQEISLEEVNEFTKTLGLPTQFEIRDYQIRGVALGIRHKRCVLISPTASGKSLIAYILTRYYGVKTLIVVPTISLVNQLIGDFKEYGYEGDVHGVTGGIEKHTNLDITVSTWQSIYEQDEDFFSGFELMIGDEAHLFAAKSLISVMTKMTNTIYRIGMTGTLDGSLVNELVLTGLFGPVEKLASTSELIADKTLADLKIKILLLKHNKDITKPLIGEGYFVERDYLVGSKSRNTFIKNLALSLTGNTLILFALVEKHGRELHRIIAEKRPERLYYVSGEVDKDDRNDIRRMVEESKDAIVVASYGVFSTGINIKRIHNIIFASPAKSRIRVMQSIGRGLRRGDAEFEKLLKEDVTIFDIADDLSFPNNVKKNHTLLHLIERIKMYNSESFPYVIHTIKIKDSDNGKSFVS